MWQITDYYTVLSSSSTYLDKLVREMIQEGWQPFGGAAVAVVAQAGFDDVYTYCQAMVKYAQGVWGPGAPLLNVPPGR